MRFILTLTSLASFLFCWISSCTRLRNSAVSRFVPILWTYRRGMRKTCVRKRQRTSSASLPLSRLGRPSLTSEWPAPQPDVCARAHQLSRKTRATAPQTDRGASAMWHGRTNAVDTRHEHAYQLRERARILREGGHADRHVLLQRIVLRIVIQTTTARPAKRVALVIRHGPSAGVSFWSCQADQR